MKKKGFKQMLCMLLTVIMCISAFVTPVQTAQAATQKKVKYEAAKPIILGDSNCIVVATAKEFGVPTREPNTYANRVLNRTLKTVKVDGKKVKFTRIAVPKRWIDDTTNSKLGMICEPYLYKIPAKKGRYTVEATDSAGITKKTIVYVSDFNCPMISNLTYCNFYKGNPYVKDTQRNETMRRYYGVSTSKSNELCVTTRLNRTVKNVKIVRNGKVIYNKKPKILNKETWYTDMYTGMFARNAGCFYVISDTPRIRKGDIITVTDSKNYSTRVRFNQRWDKK